MSLGKILYLAISSGNNSKLACRLLKKLCFSPLSFSWNSSRKSNVSTNLFLKKPPADRDSKLKNERHTLSNRPDNKSPAWNVFPLESSFLNNPCIRRGTLSIVLIAGMLTWKPLKTCQITSASALISVFGDLNRKSDSSWLTSFKLTWIRLSDEIR